MTDIWAFADSYIVEIAIVVAWIVLSVVVAWSARRRGRSGLAWLLLALLLSPIIAQLLLLLVLPIVSPATVSDAELQKNIQRGRAYALLFNASEPPVELVRVLKRAIDPGDTFNPGKIL